jgi:hypothetical protein
MNTRCDAVTIQLIVTDYDEHGRPTGERISQPMKLFRAGTPDVWAAVDAAIAQPPTPPAPSPAPLAAVKGKRR